MHDNRDTPPIFHVSAYHEAGHVVMARINKFRIIRILIDNKGNGASIIEYDAPYANQGIGLYLERRIGVLLAGAISQCIMAVNFDKSCLDKAFKSNASHDWGKIQELAMALRNMNAHDVVDTEKLDAEMNAIYNELIERTHETLSHSSSMEAISRIANHLIHNIEQASKINSEDTNAILTNTIDRELLETFCADLGHVTA